MVDLYLMYVRFVPPVLTNKNNNMKLFTLLKEIYYIALFTFAFILIEIYLCLIF